MFFVHQLNLAKLHCVAITLWTSVSIHDIPIQFRISKEDAKEKSVFLIETVGVDKKK